MRYSPPHPDRARLSAGGITLVVHLGLASLFLFALAEGWQAPPRKVDATPPITDVLLSPPPPPQRHPYPHVARVAARSRPARSAPAPAALAAPAPRIIPAIVPLAPVLGTVPAGGGGTGGTGAGTGGNGEGGDGSGGGGGTPPERIRGRIKDSDYPHDLSETGVSGTVSVRYRVGIDGRVNDCLVTHSSGSNALDVLTCRLIEQRFRFRPSRDEDGRPVPSFIVENHSWIIPWAPSPGGEGADASHSQR